MKNSIDITPTENKDHYALSINGVSLGEWELSQLRHLIQVIDNVI